MSDDPYQPPKNETRDAKTLGQVAWSQQSLFGAFFGGVMGAFIGVALWIMVAMLVNDNTIIMSLLVAICVGLFVRFNGRGLTVVYSVIAAFFGWAGTIAGLVFTSPPAQGGGIVGVLVLFSVGGVAAVLARRPLDDDTRKSVWRLRNGIVRDE